MCSRNDTGEYLLIEGDFALGNKGRFDEEGRYIRPRRTHGADYLKWFGRVNCMWEVCMGEGVIWDIDGIPQRGCPTHLETNLFQGGGNRPGNETRQRV